ncbi:hypothetical protein [Corynebacterium phoceense]|uniref:hypothetical protein n=1 Tax=Corynebacterium phoceense TaxID=1686286 RepID=UPI00211BAA9F|nr:hypothetical protein [Corynebacterium phoceense]MCQ9330432.1 hypothetical protein [Corynebacterium phoceense]
MRQRFNFRAILVGRDFVEDELELVSALWRQFDVDLRERISTAETDVLANLLGGGHCDSRDGVARDIAWAQQGLELLDNVLQEMVKTAHATKDLIVLSGRYEFKEPLLNLCHSIRVLKR